MHRLFVPLVLSLLMVSANGWAAGVRVAFDPSKPEIGPFPTDYLTAPATNTKTARMVRMPVPGDCNAVPNACQESWLASMFDGFNPQGRVRVRFTGAINPSTIANGVFLVARENLTDDEIGVHKTGDVMKLNQIVYDPSTNTAYGKPDGPMDQHRRYLLVVTDAVKDTAGDAVESDAGFTTCAGGGDEYCTAVSNALKNTTVTGKVVAASVYSTMSVTSWLEKARNQLNDLPPSASSIGYFPVEDIRFLTWRVQASASAIELTDVNLPIDLIRTGVRAVAFGSFQSTNHLSGADRTIPAIASNDRLPADPRKDAIHYTAYLPTGEKPSSGYPVVIYGHGLGDSRLGGPAVVGLTLGKNNIATIAINAVGHGFGLNSKLLVGTRSQGDVEVPAPGRGIDLNQDGRIDPSEGCGTVVSSPLGLRDCLRQTTVDLIQLVRVIKAGIDLDGDGSVDLDPRQIFYVGQSLGSLYGTMLMAVDSTVQTAALNAGGGSVIDIARWSVNLHAASALNLFVRSPSLLNAGVDYDESYVLRNQPVRSVTTAGSIDIQNVFEMQEWLQAEGDPSLYASHLKLSPLSGVSEKKVLWLIGRGDQTVPNNTSSTLVRNAGMIDTTWLYRHDTARRFAPLPKDPHQYMTGYIGVDATLNLFAVPIANAVQSQIAELFKTGEIKDPNGLDQSLFFFYPPNSLFEKPATLPEDLNYLE